MQPSSVDSTLYDFVVVGAGIAGASLAYRLSADGAKVLVLERESQPGYHSTGRSAAMFMESYGTPQIRALTRASRAFYTQPPAGFSEHALITPRGALYIGRPGQQNLLNQAFDTYTKENIEVHRLSAAEALALVPCLNEDELIGAVLDNHATDIDVNALHQGFLKGMSRQGAQLLNNAELHTAEQKAGVWFISLADGRSLQARTLVNAAGAWADTLAARCGAQALGIQPMRRSAFLFTAGEGVDVSSWPAVLGVDESFYFKHDAGQLLGSPANADPVEAHDVVADEIDIATGIYRIEEATHLRIRRPSHVWAGLRSFAPDHEFVIGWDTQIPSLFWLAGQGGYGIQTAAAASELASALLQKKAVPAALLAHGVNADIVSPQRLQATPLHAAASATG